MANYHDRDLLSQHQRDKTTNHNCDMKTLAERLTAAREEKGLTQPELARAAGVKNQSSIGMLESGARKSSSYIPAIADALGVTALWLAEGKGPRTPTATPHPNDTSTPQALDEPSPLDTFERLGAEAHAKLLIEQAGEVSSRWMALPPDRRQEVLQQLRDETSHTPGDAKTLTQRQRKGPGTVRAQDTKGRRAAG